MDEAAGASQVREALGHANALGFFRFIALLERLTGGEARVGGTGPLSAESIRFHHDRAMTFSAGDISAVEVTRDEPVRVDITTAFLGLTGSVTPLPLYFAEEAADPDASEALTGFLDLFNHRLLSLLYRATIKYQVASESSQRGDDVWATRLFALAGIDSSTQRLGLDAATVLSLLPALVNARRSPAGLESALRLLLTPAIGETPVRVEPFSGGWVSLDERDLCRLGASNSVLGREMVLGNQVFDRASRFRVEIGPVDAPALLEKGTALRSSLEAIIGLFVNDWLACDVSIIVSKTGLRLSSTAGSRLGIDSWLASAANSPSSLNSTASASD